MPNDTQVDLRNGALPGSRQQEAFIRGYSSVRYLLMKSQVIDVGFNSDLEKAVEQLSELLNEPIVDNKIPELRQKVIDKTVCILSVLFMHFEYFLCRYMYKRDTIFSWRM